MKRFKKILVGVDLSWGDCFVADELSEPNAEAVRQALWLGQLNSASVDFLFSLDLSAKAQQLIAESNTDETIVLDEAENRLAELVAKARHEGVDADSHVVAGKSWLELIRQVHRNQHDLVLVGTRHMSAMRGFFLGSTAIKLLRKCPCAVWVTQPRAGQDFDSILVAHDLRPVGDLAMELGCSMASLQDAQLHVVHAAEFPEFDYMFPARISAERKQAYRNEAERHIETQLVAANLPMPAKMHFVIEPPDIAITNCIEQHDIDLVVMGTVGRTGIEGFITGNTAERLLSQIPCSLLAVKPPGFESPVSSSRL
jgi:universal stress protein E